MRSAIFNVFFLKVYNFRPHLHHFVIFLLRLLITDKKKLVKMGKKLYYLILYRTASCIPRIGNVTSSWFWIKWKRVLNRLMGEEGQEVWVNQFTWLASAFMKHTVTNILCILLLFLFLLIHIGQLSPCSYFLKLIIVLNSRMQNVHSLYFIIYTVLSIWSL